MNSPGAIAMGDSPVRHPVRMESSPIVMDSSDPTLLATELGNHWVRRAVGRALPVLWGEADAPADGPSIHLSLLSAVPAMVPRGPRELPPLRLALRLAVAVRAPTAAEADAILIALAFAAAETGTPEIEPSAPSIGEALSRPLLVLRVLVERPRLAAKPTPLVREPLTTRWSTATTIRGRVLGPQDVPISGAFIEVAGFGVAEYSNHRGEFSLAALGRGGDVEPVLVVGNYRQ